METSLWTMTGRTICLGPDELLGQIFNNGGYTSDIYMLFFPWRTQQVIVGWVLTAIIITLLSTAYPTESGKLKTAALGMEEVNSSVRTVRREDGQHVKANDERVHTQLYPWAGMRSQPSFVCSASDWNACSSYSIPILPCHRAGISTAVQGGGFLQLFPVSPA